jgi:hypothetical protein
MSTIQRPTFYDGQILAAADLGDSIGYARDQMARHERYLHSWGIGFGFDFQLTNQTSGLTAYVQVTIAAGLAVDGRGREAVLASPQLLDPLQFSAAHVYDPANPDPWYPVCVQGILPTPTPQAALMGACNGANQPTRQPEGVQFNFLPAGSVKSADAPYPTPGPGDPTDPTSDTAPWSILIGFVQWDPNITQFTAGRAYNDSGVARRLAGVQAARVEGRDGNVELQTSNNPSTRLLLVMQEAVGNTPGSMTFGADDGQGGVTKLLQVNASGDLSIAGKFGSATPLAPGSVTLQSGIATDGMTLPLPAGVTDDQVSTGKVLLHMQVTPMVPDTVPVGIGLANVFAIVPLGCYVDASRRVRCRLRYLANGTPIGTADVAGTCQYTIVAAPAAGGPSS